MTVLSRCLNWKLCTNNVWAEGCVLTLPLRLSDESQHHVFGETRRHVQTDRLGSVKELFVTVVGLMIEGLKHTNSVDVQIKDCTKIISRTLAPLVLVSNLHQII